MQELAEGKSLAQMVEDGWRADDEEVARLAKEVLRILAYLGRRRPAVTHRYCCSRSPGHHAASKAPLRSACTMSCWTSYLATRVRQTGVKRQHLCHVKGMQACWSSHLCHAPNCSLQSFFPATLWHSAVKGGMQEVWTMSKPVISASRICCPSSLFICFPCLCRDVKAENIVLEGGQAGGRVYLVDFGGVQAAAAGDALQTGSTIIGTYGYMAPEQFRGQATPASDLYGLGGTLLFVLSGVFLPIQHPCRCTTN